MRAFLLPASLVMALALVFQVGIRLMAKSNWRAMRTGMQADIDAGSLQALLRARMAGLRLVAGAPNDGDAAGDLAYVDAVLTAEYGLPFANEAEQAAAIADAAVASASAERTGLIVSARALVNLSLGKREAALAVLTAAGTVARDAPHAYLPLGRARARAGELGAALRAFQAAVLMAPDFKQARLAWAEACLDSGDPEGARNALAPLLADGSDLTSARLLVDEANRATGREPNARDAALLDEACRRDGALAPSIDAACALRAAATARQADDRGTALTAARHAAVRATGDPRSLGRAAQVLAQLGHVDEADELVARASKLADGKLPPLAWAHMAVVLGRGQLVTRLAAVPALGPEVRVLVARAALAESGPPGLTQMLAPAGSADFASHPDLRQLARVLHADQANQADPADEPRGGGPVAAYVDGLIARLRGDLPAAIAAFESALQGHGDACRAAGEYVAALRAAGQVLDPRRLSPLRSVNARCVNLAPANVDEPALKAPVKKRTRPQARVAEPDRTR